MHIAVTLVRENVLGLKNSRLNPFGEGSSAALNGSREMGKLVPNPGQPRIWSARIESTYVYAAAVARQAGLAWHGMAAGPRAQFLVSVEISAS